MRLDAVMTTANGRTADHEIEPLFLRRWSPRHFTGESMPTGDLHRLFEAARWAPSSSNLQPWRFLHATRESPDWPLFFEPLSEGNRRWVGDTAVLIAVLSRSTAPVKGSDAVKESYSHSFDAGAAWMSLALQAEAIGWAAHAMGGFDLARATAALRVPDDYRLECMVAVGRPRHDPEKPTEPRGRAPQKDFVRAGAFPPPSADDARAG